MIRDPFLEELLYAAGPSGMETSAAEVWRTHAAGYAKVERDRMGNSYAIVNAKGKVHQPVVLLAGHIDEIGVIITHIDEDGFLYIDEVGGWDAQVLVGQRIRFLSDHGNPLGVVGRKPPHLLDPDEEHDAVTLKSLWVDIGATSREEALTMVEVGDMGVLDQQFHYLPNKRLVSRCLDNRIGAYVVFEAARRYAANPGEAKVIAAATVQEEVGFANGGGAGLAGRLYNPDVAIAVDLTFATDHPDAKKEQEGDHSLGGGPVLARGTLLHPEVFRLLRSAAVDNDIPYTVQALGYRTRTDADVLATAALYASATGLVSVPNRYMHSPNEMVSLEDVEHTIELLVAACQYVRSDMDWRR